MQCSRSSADWARSSSIRSRLPVGTHDLVLHARVADYDPAWCELLYERREIFEAYNKGLSLVPTASFRGSA